MRLIKSKLNSTMGVILTQEERTVLVATLCAASSDDVHARMLNRPESYKTRLDKHRTGIIMRQLAEGLFKDL